MKKKKKIALVGLNKVNNMGDQIIAETTQYLIEKKFNDEIETYLVDMSPYDSYCKLHLPIRFKVFNLIRSFESFFSHDEKVLYYLQYFSWRIKLLNYYKHHLEFVDAVIFTGGGLIKYNNQELNYLIDLITNICLTKNIPVMFNAVGVEEYSENDQRCQKLKNAINRPCVRVITTRDDLKMLKERYIYNKSIVTGLVGDPAFYIPERYSVRRKEKGLIGLGVIRSDIFIKYGINFDEKQVLYLYQSIISEFERRSIDWKIFSNGFTSDHQFAVELLNSLGFDKSKVVTRPKSTAEYINTVSEFDAIIGARLHACITAYSLDIPVVGLIWNPKLRLFGKMIEKENCFLDSEQFEPQTIVNLLQEELESQYDEEGRNLSKIETEKYLIDFIKTVVK